MLKITEKFEKELEDIRKKSLRQRIQLAFDTLWYDSIIPEAATNPLLKACDLISPCDADDDDTLQAKGLLIRGLANNVFGTDDRHDQIANFEIDACVIPDDSRSGIAALIEQQKSEA